MQKRKWLLGIVVGLALINVLWVLALNRRAAANAKTSRTKTETSSAGTEAAGTEASQTEAAETQSAGADTKGQDGDIMIVYTNDVHSYIDNVIKDKDGNITGDGLRFSKVRAFVDDRRAEGKNVLLVDAGDEIQGDVYGAMDEGATVLRIMETAGYQLATPGNHEFDYGTTAFLKLAETTKFPYITCNFHPTDTDETIFKKYMIFDIAGKKVAFVGITTPDLMNSSTPAYFQNEKGEYIYAVEGAEKAEDVYECVQKTVDEVRPQADYVIALGHVGIGLDERAKGIASTDIISHVSGLDAFIDGHSHSVVEQEPVKDKDGKNVILTQTGSYFANFGVMTIAGDGTIRTELLSDYDREDEETAAIETQWIKAVTDKMGEKIGTLDVKLGINNPDDDKQRFIRAMEMNIGNFTTDSVYWYFNEKMGLDCDVTILNGGGIRADIDAGDVSMLSVKRVEPFGNMICLIEANGQQILDALEMGATMTGEWDSEWNIPAENGGFLHASGLRYTIDATIPSSVKTNEAGAFQSVDGEYRVRNVEIYNKKTGKYEPLEPDRKYQVGGLNYILRNGGNGLTMFENDKLVVDYVGQDYIILAEYVRSFAEENGYPRVNTANSPLLRYEGFLLDYEDPYGAGRIEIRLPK